MHEVKCLFSLCVDLADLGDFYLKFLPLTPVETNTVIYCCVVQIINFQQRLFISISFFYVSNLY